jgi:hypothetical protein
VYFLDINAITSFLSKKENEYSNCGPDGKGNLKHLLLSKEFTT